MRFTFQFFLLTLSFNKILSAVKKSKNRNDDYLITSVESYSNLENEIDLIQRIQKTVRKLENDRNFMRKYGRLNLKSYRKRKSLNPTGTNVKSVKKLRKKSRNQCPKNEYYSSCANGSCHNSNTCNFILNYMSLPIENRVNFKCGAITSDQCRSGCRCRNNFFRDTKTNKCVEYRNCHKTRCGRNAYFGYETIDSIDICSNLPCDIIKYGDGPRSASKNERYRAALKPQGYNIAFLGVNQTLFKHLSGKSVIFLPAKNQPVLKRKRKQSRFTSKKSIKSKRRYRRSSSFIGLKRTYNRYLRKISKDCQAKYNSIKMQDMGSLNYRQNNPAYLESVYTLLDLGTLRLQNFNQPRANCICQPGYFRNYNSECVKPYQCVYDLFGNSQQQSLAPINFN